jgi:hypothetical protein
MVSIVINHVMGAYPIIVIGNLVFAQIHLDVNLEGCLMGRMHVWSVIQVYARDMVPFFFIKIIRYQKRNKKVGKSYRNNHRGYGIRIYRIFVHNFHHYMDQDRKSFSC